jgi:hypothetical protein
MLKKGMTTKKVSSNNHGKNTQYFPQFIMKNIATSCWGADKGESISGLKDHITGNFLSSS